MSLLKQNTTRIRQINKLHKPKFEIGNNKKYTIKAIWDSIVYANKTIESQLLGLYYLIS